MTKINNIDFPKLVTIEEFCKLFKITRITAVRWIKAGKLKRLKIQGRVFIEQSEIDILLEEARRQD